MFAAIKTNVVDDAIEVEDSTAPGSSKESGNKRGHEKKPSSSEQVSNRVSGNK